MLSGDVVDEDDSEGAVPEGGHELGEYILPRRVEEMELDGGVRVRDRHRLHRELRAACHHVPVGRGVVCAAHAMRTRGASPVAGDTHVARGGWVVEGGGRTALGSAGPTMRTSA